MTNWQNPGFEGQPLSGSNEIVALSERSILHVVLDITNARKAAEKESLRQKQIAAVSEIHDTIDTLVELLAVFDYPGAEIVAGVERVESDANQTKNYKVDIPLWPIEVVGLKGIPLFSFGPDKKLYKRDFEMVWNDSLNHPQQSEVYLPIEKPDENWIFAVKDGLNNFPLPTEDSLLR